MTNEISFKQNIRFVDAKTFREMVSKGAKYIECSDTASCIKGKSFVTYGIMSCTAGGFRNAGRKAFGFHYYDCCKGLKHIENNCTKLYNAIRRPTSGLLIGGKHIACARYSIPIFSKMEKFFSGRIKNLSIFREHSHYDGETSFTYDSKTDTWGILAQWGDSNFVKTTKDLKNFYKEIIIANGDRVFIGDKEIDPKEIMKPGPKSKNQ